MYCVICSAENPDYGTYCHKCGNALVRSLTVEEVARVPVKPRVPSEEEQLVRLLQIDPKPNECHICGDRRAPGLERFIFGIVKVLSTKRAWGAAVGSVAFSALSLTLAPGIGFGGVYLRGPGKNSTLRVLRAELVLCGDCARQAVTFFGNPKLKPEHYMHHPWARGAVALGYDHFLSDHELNRLTPARESRKQS